MTDGLNIGYTANFYSQDESDCMMNTLCHLPFESYTILGHVPRRKMCAYSDTGIFKYPYSGITMESKPFPSFLLKMKRRVEEYMGTEFNFALINYYENGNARIGAHRDDESCMDLTAPIAGVSFGSTRTLKWKREGYRSVSMAVEHGSLYWMKPPTNQFWTHEIPVQKKVKKPRISITFRRFKE